MSYFEYSNQGHGDMRDLGINHLNLEEAGELIAKCLWLDGQIKVDTLEEDAYSFHDPALKEPLKKESAHYTKLLAAAAEKGTLKPVLISRKLDDKINAAGTYVRGDELLSWLDERNVSLGDFYEEYIEFEAYLFEKALDMIEAERVKKSLGQKDQESKPKTYNEDDYWRLYKKTQKLEEEMLALKSSTENIKPISEKQRGAYLRIIGSLLGLLLSKPPNGKPYSRFTSQQAIIDAIHDAYGDANGLSKRNLEEQFSQAKRSLPEAAIEE